MSAKIQTRSELIAKIARLRSQKERLEAALDEIGKIVDEELGEEDQDTDCDVDDEEEEDSED